jgi:hypothetical protein
MPYEAANQHHPSGQGSVQATRNPDAERGVGRAFRHEADMLPIAPVNIRTQLAGMSACRASLAGPAVRQEQTLTPKKSLNVAVRSGNIDPRAVGINKANWGMAGVGDAAAENMAALNEMIDASNAEKAKNKKLIIGGLIAVAAIFLINKSRHA